MEIIKYKTIVLGHIGTLIGIYIPTDIIGVTADPNHCI